jgi:hypothetical protein
VTGLKSESVTSFIPESRPASFRNADRDRPGIVTALPRNPQFDLAFGSLLDDLRLFRLNGARIDTDENSVYCPAAFGLRTAWR